MRERVALPDALAEDFMSRLLAGGDVAEAVAISTCNRTEVYARRARPGAAETPCWASWPARPASGPPSWPSRSTRVRNCDAARHLYRVTAGLESMIVGEAEVQGQVRLAFDLALRAGMTGPLSNRVFGAALATGKRVRSETAISEAAASVPSVAVAGRPSRRSATCASRRVVILGTGEMAELHGAGAAARRRGPHVHRQPPPRARAWRGRALRRPRGRLRRHCRASSSARTSSSAPPPRPTRSWATTSCAS